MKKLNLMLVFFLGCNISAPALAASKKPPKTIIKKLKSIKKSINSSLVSLFRCSQEGSDCDPEYSRILGAGVAMLALVGVAGAAWGYSKFRSKPNKKETLGRTQK